MRIEFTEKELNDEINKVIIEEDDRTGSKKVNNVVCKILKTKTHITCGIQ